MVELSEDNNLAIRSLLVKTSAEAAGPDLVPLEFNLSAATTDPQSLHISGLAKVKFQNKGDDKITTPFRITLFEDKDGDGFYTEGADVALGNWGYTASMNPSMVGIVNIMLNGTLTFRDAPIYAMVDSLQTVAEQVEVNNTIRKGSACETRPVNPIEPVLKWQWRGGRTVANNLQIPPPTVIGLTDDNGDGKMDEQDIPSVVFVTQAQLKALNGKTGAERFSVTRDFTNAFAAGTYLAAGDINNDHKPELVLMGAYSGLLSFSNDGRLLWDNTATVQPWIVSHNVSVDLYYNRVPKVADIDGNGQPVIVVGATIVNGDGSIRSSGLFGHGDGVNGAMGDSVVADLDMDGKQEVVTGNTAYNTDSSVKWYNPAIRDGVPVIANFDDDPYPEIVVLSGLDGSKLYLLDHTGQIKWGPVSVSSWEGWYGNYASVPTVADFDGDGELEIGIKGNTHYFIIDKNGRLKLTLSTPRIILDSIYPAATVFDLNGDGHPEVMIYSDQYLRVFDGKAGTLLFEQRVGQIENNPYGNSYLGVVVADVDGDSHAEMVVAGQNFYPSDSYSAAEHWIKVYGAKNNDWQNTRRTWNQLDYHVTNINDDGSIPQYEAPSWLLNNNYRCQVPVGTSTGNPYVAADLSASFIRADMGNYPASVTVTTRIGNGGAKAVDPGIKTAFYDGDPANGGALIGTAITTKTLNPGDFEDASIVWNAPRERNHTIYVVADPDNTVAECDKANNSAFVATYITNGQPDLSILPEDVAVRPIIYEGNVQMLQ
ncbi:FG-GAP-like repeat-containing protein [Geotalea toluenoxydans]|uniref:FG-GAP-like repeat-containing protein n=1 Tax=Geotalea toluenoxydans TaxID=421624 RepID=UPI0006D1F612|nr:FG-GAP-like repeat-containing protein [Geotalea toluenoxydans]